MTKFKNCWDLTKISSYSQLVPVTIIVECRDRSLPQKLEMKHLSSDCWLKQQMYLDYFNILMQTVFGSK